MEILNTPLQTLDSNIRPSNPTLTDRLDSMEAMDLSPTPGQLKLFEGNGTASTAPEDDPSLPPEIRKYHRLIREFQDARNLYAFRSAGKISETLYRGKNRGYSRRSVRQAESRYQTSRHDLLSHQVFLAEDSGAVSGNDSIEAFRRNAARSLDATFTRSVASELLAHTREYEYERDGNNNKVYDSENKVVMTGRKAGGGIARRASTLAHKWWGEQNDTKGGRLKKASLVAGLGVAATAGSILLPPAAGAVLGISEAAAAFTAAFRISYSSAYYYMDGTGEKRRIHERLAKDLTEAEGLDYSGMYDRNSLHMSRILDKTAAEESKNNRRRAKIALGVVLAGTALGEVVHLFGVNALVATGHA